MTREHKKYVYTIAVRETYTKNYQVEANSPEEAEEIAEALAADDLDLAIPENMDSREIDFID